MFRWIAKRAVPVIASNLILDVDTVHKETGTYLRVRVEVFGMKLLDRLIKLNSQPDKPIEVNPNE